MTAIRCRWHDAGVAGVPPATPGKQAAAAFALYGLRLQPKASHRAQSRRPSPSPAPRGYFFGQLDLDAVDAQFMLDAISGMLNLKYGPWRSEDVERLLAERRAGRPGNRGVPATGKTASGDSRLPCGLVTGPARCRLGRCTSVLFDIP